MIVYHFDRKKKNSISKIPNKTGKVFLRLGSRFSGSSPLLDTYWLSCLLSKYLSRERYLKFLSYLCKIYYSKNL